MKLNIANPSCGLQKIVEVDDEKKLLPFFEKRMGAEVEGDSIGDEFKGYVFKISGGNDKQGFPMLQGVLVNHRVRILFKKGMKCFRPRRDGQRKRKSVRGCIVGPDLAVLNLVLLKKGPEEIPGLTDSQRPRRLGPKRASNIRKLFNLTKDDDVRQYVVRRKIEGRNKTKAPKIQRLVTPQRIRRKRLWKAEKKRRMAVSLEARKEYAVMIRKYEEGIQRKRLSEVAKKSAKKTKKTFSIGEGTGVCKPAPAQKSRKSPGDKPTVTPQADIAGKKVGAKKGGK